MNKQELKSISKDPTVFIIINNNNIYTPFTVSPAYDYQEDALNDYIENHLHEPKKYNPQESIIFYIDKFDSSNLQGDYSDFYSFIRDDGSKSTISKNKEKLSNFCGYVNRLTSYNM